MVTEEQLEGNKLINAFMGYPYNMTESGYPTEVLYHSDWNWIMDVVNKIENLQHSFITYRNKDRTEYFCEVDRLIGTRGDTKIEAVWKACVAFVKYYNSINNNDER